MSQNLSEVNKAKLDKEFYLKEWREFNERKGEIEKCIICYLYTILYILLPLITLVWHAYIRSGFMFSGKFFHSENIVLLFGFVFVSYAIFWGLDRLSSYFQLEARYGSEIISVLLFVGLFAGLYLLSDALTSIAVIITFSFVFLMSIAAPIGQPTHTLRLGMFGTLEFVTVSILSTLAFSAYYQYSALFALSFSLVILLFIRSRPDKAQRVTIYRSGKPVRERGKSYGRISFFFIIPWIEKAEYS